MERDWRRVPRIERSRYSTLGLTGSTLLSIRSGGGSFYVSPSSAVGFRALIKGICTLLKKGTMDLYGKSLGPIPNSDQSSLRVRTTERSLSGKKVMELLVEEDDRRAGDGKRSRNTHFTLPLVSFLDGA